MQLSSLNPEQREAVTTTHGPVLLLAGAGSGKTRVIIQRIIHLIQVNKISPYHILAVTFTNKAAKEMQERLYKLLPKKTKGIRISTFHSLCVAILRQHIDLLGYRSNFIIYDSHDQMSVVKNVLEETGHDDTGLIDAKEAHFMIGQAKIARQDPQYFLQQSDSQREMAFGEIYEAYQHVLKGCNAVDFEDLLGLALRLFEEHPEEMQSVREKYRFVMVDEYQDTNRSQYLLLKHLCRHSRNLCVVGDDDQSIYGWRGADIENILNFEKDYPEAKTIKLEQNYRSTRLILRAANQVIANNSERMSKQLWSERGEGELLGWVTGDKESDEMEQVVNRIRSQCARLERPYRDYAILYRSNFQSRAIEEALREQGVPYELVGSTSFYDRKEIKDAIAYLKVIHNPNDEVSLHRIINFPKRGIGKTSLIHANAYCHNLNLSLYDVLKNASQYNKIPNEAAHSMEVFVTLIQRYQHRFNTEPMDVVFRHLLDEVGYLRALEKEKADPKTKEKRLQFVQEFLNSTKSYMERNPEATLNSFLDRVMLMSSQDDTAEQKGNHVTLMTFHSAKGLEFPYVFMVGMAESVFPNQRSLEESGECEERRLCYVGITRAQKELTFSMAKARRRYGETLLQTPSRFLFEIDAALFSRPIEGALPPEKQKVRDDNAKAQFFAQIAKLRQAEAEVE